jgi:signal transduction histidine kinase
MWNRSSRRPHQLRIVFLAVMILLASTLGCVAWWLLDQDRQLATQRLGERLDTAADLTVATLEKRLSDIDQTLDRMLSDRAEKPAPPPAGSLLVQFLPGSIRVWPDDGLAYYPVVAEMSEASDSLFAVADEMEFQNRDYSKAIAALREFTASSEPKVRAAALVRVARNELKGGSPQEALKASRQLADLGPVTVGGLPAALAGALGAVYVHQQQKDQASLETAVSVLDHELNSGRWKISSATYGSLIQERRRVLAASESFLQPRAALAGSVEWLWEQWIRERTTLSAGRQSLALPGGPVLLVWRTSGNSAVMFAAGSGFLESDWLAEVQPRFDTLHVQLALTDSEGRLVLGKSPITGSRPAIKLESQTKLPWTIQVFNTGDEAVAFGSRRTLLLVGMSVLLALILTGAWFIGYAVSRELAVARLQTEFVSAVSHEFRTPLTTLCQLSELLRRDRVSGEQDRRQYYELLYSESNRLRRLVETLLDFGRLETGKLQFHFEELDAAALVRQAASDFMESQQTPDHHIEVETPLSPVIHADRETLRCVFWNLFENAVKYSPGCDTVWVNLSCSGQHVEIAVRDRGVGIPKGEHRRIFEKFVRGAAARESKIGGVGMGLAMARQIVREHGGDITLDSEPGKGSTFRVVLPETGKPT